jgi:hypothetical protein
VRRPRVEILYVEGCPSREVTRTLVERIATELQVEAEVALVEVPDAETAEQRRFLGSPSIRVDGDDVEPGTEERSDFVLACRVYRTRHGLSGEPDPAWIREALSRAAA